MKVLAAFTPILVADTDPAFDEVAGKYGIEGFPTVVFARHDGTEIVRSVGAGPVDEFRRTAQQALSSAR